MKLAKIPFGSILLAAPLLVGAAPPTGNLLVSRSVYAGDASTVTIGQKLPGGGSKLAVADGTYPGVWNNEAQDASFGVTSPIFLDRSAVVGGSMTSVNTLALPTTQLVTSFPSKSEMGLNLSTDGKSITFMGYVAPVNALDVSNSNTLNHVDPTNPVALIYPRGVAQFDATGSSSSVQVTSVNAYSGNNGRAAIFDVPDNQYFMVGNAGNGSGTEPVGVVNNTGVQIVTPGANGESQVVGKQQGTPGAANGFEFGFSIAQLGLGTDKSGKDDNFRGMTVFNNTLYVTKGSGSNGINTVYQVGTAGTLPTPATAAAATFSILPGFSTVLAKSTTGVVMNPFGIWFANATTLYVADEGDGAVATAAANPNSGLEKWVLESDGKWHNVYTLKNGLNLGVPYSVPGMPSSLNPAADGLRTLSGRVNGDGTVTLFAVTSTVSAAVDQGADPNQLVSITDNLSFLTAADAAGEAFTILKTAAFGEVLRGVAFVPLAPPTAVAGPNQAITVTQTVHLDGSASFADNTPSASLQYAWSLVSRPAGSSAALSDANVATPAFNADVPGDFVAQLIVTDPATGLQSAPSQATISSVWAPPAADAGPAQSGLVGSPVTLSGNGTDPQDLALSFAWNFISVPAGSAAVLANGNAASVSFTPDLAGTYTLTLAVSDMFGSSQPDTVSVSVITADDYAQQQISNAINVIGGLPVSHFDARGHRQSLHQLLHDAIEDIQQGRVDEARGDLNEALIRTDGYPLRGKLDEKGPGRDWILDPAAQAVVYQDLKNALGVLPVVSDCGGHDRDDRKGKDDHRKCSDDGKSDRDGSERDGR